MTADFEAVSVANVSRAFGRRRVLADVSFTCRRGDVLALLGPNGAGKSTLLAILATLLAPSSGEVQYDGRPARGDAALRGRIGWLGHELQLYPELTGRENLRFFARLHGVPGVEQAVGEALARARLEHAADDLVASYSRGMRQRLALERALLHAPRLLLLDEPFTGLDHRSALDLIERLRLLARDGTIVMMATHDMETAGAVLTRAVVLRGGRIAADAAGAQWRDTCRQALALSG
ncbi:MAG TPA: heme ABC exporter ATP-binding protein CcmA [Vicinamibacterales bacterium]